MNRSEPDRTSRPADHPTRRSPWRLMGWATAILLLLTPLVAMQFTDAVRWTAGDFLVFGFLLLMAGGLLEFVFRMRSDLAWRVGGGLAVIAGFLLLWAQGAVGLVGDGKNLASVAILAGAGTAIAVGLVLLARRGRHADWKRS